LHDREERKRKKLEEERERQRRRVMRCMSVQKPLQNLLGQKQCRWEGREKEVCCALVLEGGRYQPIDDQPCMEPAGVEPGTCIRRGEKER
jgi:hypothetical protein